MGKSLPYGRGSDRAVSWPGDLRSWGNRSLTVAARIGQHSGFPAGISDKGHTDPAIGAGQSFFLVFYPPSHKDSTAFAISKELVILAVELSWESGVTSVGSSSYEDGTALMHGPI